MFELTVQSSTRTYPITIGPGAIESLKDRDFIILADTNLVDAAKRIGSKVIELSVSEETKTLATCEDVISQLKALGANRDTVILAIGGGYIQDIATLVSALYMRGVSWIYVPTTLMSMMDSCIGGKSSINVGSAKNLIGNFYPPMEIVIDPSLIATLDNAAIASGLSEGVKICYAKGPAAFEKFCTYRSSVENYDSVLASEWIAHVLSAKKWFVETDEFDQGPRKLLNFGHTFGHALESATNFAIPHGIAINIGVLAALQHPLSHRGTLEEKLAKECLSILAPVSEALRRDLDSFDVTKFEKAFLGDKKHSSQMFRLILSQQGTLRIVEVESNDQEMANVVEAMTKAMAVVRAGTI
ncbi:MAG: 3-dehydroquinate synthase family protein [Candidatus Nanopelagicaceae bacterium]|nr:3-dehydroquinate synthase family protein [Candidatus Nanopelagicaceae bacterium]